MLLRTSQTKQLRRVIIAAFLLLSLLLLLLLSVRPAAGQTLPVDGVGPQLPASSQVITVQQMHVQVMPEFDDHRLLVIVQGRLAAATPLPATLTVFVPRGAQINQMAQMDIASNGAITQRTYEAVPDVLDADWTRITYTIDSAHFFYEYYGQSLAGFPEKQFTFSQRTAYPIGDLQIEVQQPLKALEFTLDPLPTIARVDEGYGFTWHQFSGGSVSAESATTIEVAYTKNDPAPSLNKEQVMALYGIEPAAELENAPSSVARDFTVSSWWMVAPLAAVFAAAAWFYTSNKRRPDFAPMQLAAVTGLTAPICPGCRSQVNPIDSFCHECGHAIGR